MPVKGDGQQQEQEISGLNMSTYFICSLTAVLQGRPLLCLQCFLQELPELRSSYRVLSYRHQ